MASDFCSGPKNCTGTIINIMDTAAKPILTEEYTCVTAVGHASHQELGQSISYGIHRENDTQLSLSNQTGQVPEWPSRSSYARYKTCVTDKYTQEDLPTVTLIRRINLLCPVIPAYEQVVLKKFPHSTTILRIIIIYHCLIYGLLPGRALLPVSKWDVSPLPEWTFQSAICKFRNR